MQQSHIKDPRRWLRLHIIEASFLKIEKIKETEFKICRDKVIQNAKSKYQIYGCCDNRYDIIITMKFKTARETSKTIEIVSSIFNKHSLGINLGQCRFYIFSYRFKQRFGADTKIPW